MLTSLNETAAARLATALSIVKLIIVTLIAIALSATSGFAGAKHRRPVIVVYARPAPVVPVSPYAPYYYSAWNPYSIYSIYDHLSGGRQLCSLPSEPCDNTHRVTN
jgi:hypothetical protein